MIIRGTFQLRGRGPIIFVTLDRDLPIDDSGTSNAKLTRYPSLRRVSDGALWTIRGYERYPTMKPNGCFAGDDAGLLIDEGATPQEGDVVEWVEDDAR